MPSPYSPFHLDDQRASQWKDVRLTFHDWDWLEHTHGSTELDGYYLNGYGVEGLIKAIMFANGIDPEADGIHYNSEGDTCNVHFTSFELATQIATLASAMIRDRARLAEAIQLARAQGFED